MGDLTHGMDIEAVRRIGRALKAESGKLRTASRGIDQLVDSTASVWKGPDKAAFASRWTGGMRSQVSQMATQLADLSKKALSNADAQQSVSSTLEGGGAGTGGAGTGTSGDPDGAGGSGFQSNPPLSPSVSASREYEVTKQDEYKYKAGSAKEDAEKAEDEGAAKVSVSVPLWEANRSAAYESWDKTWGEDGRSLTVKADALYVDGGASLGISDGSLEAQASLEAGLLRASADAAYQIGLLETQGNVEGYVGAEASAKASVGKDGASASFDAFAGARASAEGSVGFAGVEAKAGVEGWAGVGASGEANFEWDDGKLEMGFEFGAALGLGGKFSWDITIDVGGMVDSVTDGFEAIGDFFDDVWPF